AKYAPGAFPASGLVLAVGVVLEQPALGLLITSLLVFPDGRVLSRRWLPSLAVGLAGTLLGIVGAIIDPRAVGSGNTPATAVPLASDLVVIGWLGLLVTGAAGVASLLVRYRRGTTEVRHQLRWIFVGAFGV